MRIVIGMGMRIVLLAILLAAAPAAAQESYDQRRAALSALSVIFGEMHHVRRLCEPDREADVWRERMKRLIELEQPSFDLREEMVRSFNAGYSSAQMDFSRCDREAEDYAAARARTGRLIVETLTTPLFAAERGEDAEGVNVIRGNE